MFIIKRTDQGGGFVAKPGNGASYTFHLARARKYQTIEEAKADLCPENEVIIDLEQLLDEVRR